MRFTITRSWARTLSRTVQSIVTFRFTASTNSRAILTSVGSPSTLTALSLTSSAVEGKFVLGQVQCLTACARRSHLLREADQLFNYLSCLDRTVLIFTYRVLQ